MAKRRMCTGENHTERKRSSDAMMDGSDQQDVSGWLNLPPRQSSRPPNPGITANAAVSDKHTAELTADKPDGLHGGTALLAKPIKAAALAEPATEASQTEGCEMLTESSHRSKKRAKRPAGAPDPTAGRRQRNVRSASSALSTSVQAAPAAEADVHGNKQADQKAPAASAEGHQHMPASSAVLSEPDQAIRTEAVIPPTALTGDLKSGGRPLPGSAGTAGRGQQGGGLSQEGQRQGGACEEVKLVQQIGIEGEAQGLSHGYR